MKIAILALAVGFVTTPALGQEGAIAHSTICPQSPDPISATALAAKVKGSAITSANKDEFETSSQHQNRISQLVEREFPGSLVSVAVPVEPHKIKYDADRGRMTIEMMRSDYSIDRSDLAVTPIQDTSRTEGYYEAQNSYGATVEVEKRSVEEVVIAWDGLTSSLSGTSAYIELDASAARLLKQHAELVIVGTLVQPFLQRRYNLDLPTLDSPTRRSTTSYAVMIKSKCVYARDANHKPYGLNIAK
jgi:hypothetical protein